MSDDRNRSADYERLRDECDEARTERSQEFTLVGDLQRKVERLQQENERLRGEAVDNYNRLQGVLQILHLPEDASGGAVRDAIARLKRRDPFWVLESSLGWKVVACWQVPQGGYDDGNWTLIMDGLEHKDAIALCRRLVQALDS